MVSIASKLNPSIDVGYCFLIKRSSSPVSPVSSAWVLRLFIRLHTFSRVIFQYGNLALFTYDDIHKHILRIHYEMTFIFFSPHYNFLFMGFIFALCSENYMHYNERAILSLWSFYCLHNYIATFVDTLTLIPHITRMKCWLWEIN